MNDWALHILHDSLKRKNLKRSPQKQIQITRNLFHSDTLGFMLFVYQQQYILFSHGQKVAAYFRWINSFSCFTDYGRSSALMAYVHGFCSQKQLENHHFFLPKFTLHADLTLYLRTSRKNHLVWNNGLQKYNKQNRWMFFAFSEERNIQLRGRWKME